MTLPAAQGGLTASFQIYASHVREWGLSVPEMGPPVAALGVTALLAACARLFEHAITQEEYVSICEPYRWVCAAAKPNADVCALLFQADWSESTLKHDSVANL